jgi:hypothetical protein
MNILGASWKPKVAAILSLLGPTSLYFILTSFAGMNTDQATAISGAVFAVLASFGLYVAKQDGVSNSPTPTLVAQPVVPVTVLEPHPSVAAPVEMAKPVVTK